MKKNYMKKFFKIPVILFFAFFLTNEKTASAQKDTIFNYTGAIQTWTVPCGVNTITVDVRGAQGGSYSSDTGGLGARMQGTFNVTPGTVLSVYVGGQGTASENAGGGGGGSGIADTTVPLIVAGGGGGASGADNLNGMPGDTLTSGGSSSGPGGTGGNGGDKGYTSGDCGWSAGGGGFYGDGYGGDGSWDGGALPGTLSGTGAGKAALNGGAGGTGGGCGFSALGAGGWGCGGGARGEYGGGGGGGYSGGGGGQYTPTPSLSPGGGGGSYNAGYSQINTKGFQTGNGLVIITWDSVIAVKDTAKTITNVGCNGGNDGSATATITAGSSAPYTYLWTGGATTDTASGLSAGTYTVTVTDNCSNVATASVTITQPSALGMVSGTTPDTGNCNGTAMVTASGGTAPYTYSWTGGGTTDTIAAKCAGTYCCTVTDSHGCMDSVCVTIISTAGIQSISNTSSIRVYPDPNRGIVNISGVKHGQVVTIYNYMGQEVSHSVVGNTNVMTLDITNKPSGIYMIRVQNNNGTIIGEQKIMKTE